MIPISTSRQGPVPTFGSSCLSRPGKHALGCLPGLMQRFAAPCCDVLFVNGVVLLLLQHEQKLHLAAFLLFKSWCYQPAGWQIPGEHGCMPMLVFQWHAGSLRNTKASYKPACGNVLGWQRDSACRRVLAGSPEHELGAITLFQSLSLCQPSNICHSGWLTMF